MQLSAVQTVDEFQKFCAEQGVDWREYLRANGYDQTARFIQAGLVVAGVAGGLEPANYERELRFRYLQRGRRGDK